MTYNSKVVRETVRTNGTVSAVMDFIYDESGSPFAFRHSTNGSSFTTYYYVLNLQGDVVKLITASGATVAEYTYNARGEVLTATGEKASVNPLRYRGYYYDTETGFYYLQSRYYDPATHRFINADAPEYSEMAAYSLDDTNLFAYCGNNPVMRNDEEGEFWHLLVGAVVGVVTQYVSDVVSNLAEGKTGLDALKPSSSIVDYAASAASGALAASGIGLAGSMAANAAISGTAYLANTVSEGKDPTLLGFATATGIGMVSGLIGGRGTDGNHIRGVWNTSKDILAAAVSPKKIAMYTAKIAACKETIAAGVTRTTLSIFASNTATKVSMHFGLE